MGTWLNGDGLYIRFGADEGKVQKTGEYEDSGYWGGEHFVEADISYTDLNAFGTDTILSDTVVIPNGARITKAEMYVITAFTSGGSATLELGTIRTDRSTTYDADGFVAATAVASLTAGATIAGSGALVNTTLANDGLLTATVRTANFTAGRARLRVFWTMV